MELLTTSMLDKTNSANDILNYQKYFSCFAQRKSTWHLRRQYVSYVKVYFLGKNEKNIKMCNLSSAINLSSEWVCRIVKVKEHLPIINCKYFVSMSKNHKPFLTDRLSYASTLSSTSRKHAYIILTPLEPHFYIVKLVFTGVYIIFIIWLKTIDCGYSLEPPRRGGSNEYPQSMFWEKIWKNIRIFFLSENFLFLGCKIFNIFE